MTSAASSVFPWQQAVWEHLLTYVRQQRIPQALMFAGPAGLGKRRLADCFAQLLLCQAQPTPATTACGVCTGCRLLRAGAHPDYFEISPDEPGKAIGIDKIRRLIEQLALKPQFEARRVVIFQPAESLNNASANAFLKCLEEPTERTSLVLVCEQAAKLPATIRSRCQIINCRPPDRTSAEHWLLQQGVGGNIQALLDMAHGAPLLAADYARLEYMELRRQYFKAWLEIAEGKTNAAALAEQWQKTENISPAVLIDWLTAWITAIIKLAYGIEAQRIGDPDLIAALRPLAEKLELQSLYRYYDLLLAGNAQIATQLNKQLLFENLLITWRQLNKP
ncbi:MAG: DNA polymerase III subunit delta' [Methylomonas sp.]|jgi:DNA polymerase-3 subunit delta'